MSEPVTAIMPVNRWDANADAALASMLGQQNASIEILIVSNGPCEKTKLAALKSADQYGNVRAFHISTESLPAALNAGLRASTNDLIVRMDADDTSRPDRVAKQQAFMVQNPSLAGCGCGTEFIDRSGHRRHIVIPPASAAQARWRLHVSNVFAHGSMMLRRRIVLDRGGYNEDFLRAQDYDLWLRLSPTGLGGIPDVLYSYRMPEEHEESELDQEQSATTARLLLDAWQALPDDEPPELSIVMAQLLRGEKSARAELESVMERDGPSKQTINAWMWSCRLHPIPATATERRATRIEAAARILIESKTSEVWLWGAGDFARTIVGSDLLGVPVAGFADDARAGDMIHGYRVYAPAQLPTDATVLIASDLYENEIWERSEPLRKNGLNVLRMPKP